MSDQAVIDMFTDFATEAEPKLKRALCSALGRDVGLEATSEALAYGWEHWENVQKMINPTGYLYRVGRSKVRPLRRWRRRENGIPLPASGPRAAPVGRTGASRRGGAPLGTTAGSRCAHQCVRLDV
jgi:predicted RNA polymerase sigma factor